MSLLEVRDLTIRYDDTKAVDGLSFTVEQGESVGLVGESGSGKSQTALAILGLSPANARIEGRVRFADTDLLGADEKTLDEFRATRVAMVFQDPMQALNPYIRIGQQLRRILIEHRIAAGETADEVVIDMLERVGLPDPAQQFRAYPHQLSGGMRQRAMIAAALIGEPDLLVADEPTTALDVTVQAQILELLEAIREDTALLLITHDLGVVAGHCERMLVLERGRLVEQGSTHRVFASPKHNHTLALMKAALRIDATAVPEAAPGEELLELDGIAVSYPRDRKARLQAVRNVDLQLKAGETVAVVGESGSGKSSLARAVLGLVPMQAGKVTFCGVTLDGPVQNRTGKTRRGLQLVFQDPAGSLNPQMIIGDIVAEPLLVHEAGLSRADRSDRAAAVLEKVGLGAEYLPRYPHELSGGQAQRVAIARALILEPQVLICDEAVAALDGTVRKQILKLLHDVQRDTGLSIIFITHDLAVVRAISHRVLVMYMGGPVEVADNEALFSNARHPYTRALLEAVPVPDPDQAGGKAMLQGEVPSALHPPGGCTFHPRCPHAQDICSSDPPEQKTVNGATAACHFAGEL